MTDQPAARCGDPRCPSGFDRWQPDGWGEGQEAADHAVNCPCYRCQIERLQDRCDELVEQLAEVGEVASGA